MFGDCGAMCLLAELTLGLMLTVSCTLTISICSEGISVWVVTRWAVEMVASCVFLTKSPGVFRMLTV